MVSKVFRVSGLARRIRNGCGRSPFGSVLEQLGELQSTLDPVCRVDDNDLSGRCARYPAHMRSFEEVTIPVHHLHSLPATAVHYGVDSEAEAAVT